MMSSLMESYRLSNSNNSLESHRSIQYKDRLYSSASQALEDYIKDYNLSLVSPEIRPGKICINQSTPRDFKSSNNCFQQKYDGSVPFNQASAFQPARQNSKSKRKSLTSPSYVRHRTSSLGKEEGMSFPGDPVISSSYKDFSRKMSAQHTFHRYDSEASGHSLPNHLVEQEDSGPSFHKNYPRWLTSQKSDLSVSGISSIPDVKYPSWLDTHHLLPDSANENFPQTRDVESDSSRLQGSKELLSSQNLGGSNNSRRSERNSFPDLENKDAVVRDCQRDCRRVCFAPDGSGEGRHSWRENDPKALLLKVKRTLESSADELANVLNNDGSPCTVDVLEAERSWDNVPVGLKSPVPVHCEENSQEPFKASIVDGYLEDCLKNSSQESTFSGGNHHGPVEALKLMLFNLQAVQQSFNLKKNSEQNKELKKASDEDVDLRQCNSDTIPVTRSLQRALYHLSRLKGLVEDMCDREELTDLSKTIKDKLT
ncbi:lung adenoma susceptibility protein 2 isoform X2 [Eublepharis macularius]|uniref:Lung adenoma susceptibility protein 2 isoform X2 n=1 Tax=Eublepharis macularius TaxID=481883 RepID=A0AA97JS55_EUBMA|nr:lung adenoma susceptibility protein 2 isoform X2 [Eublepharis macularius]